MFDQEGGRIIYFEGTDAATFSGNKDPTPRYDYNQVMYQLDLTDKRLALPVPIYAVKENVSSIQLVAGPSLAEDARSREIAFFAADRPGLAAVPIIEHRDENTGQWFLTSKSTGRGAGSTVESGQPPASVCDPRRCRETAGRDRSALRIPTAGWTRTVLLTDRGPESGLYNGVTDQLAWSGETRAV